MGDFAPYDTQDDGLPIAGAWLSLFPPAERKREAGLLARKIASHIAKRQQVLLQLSLQTESKRTGRPRDFRFRWLVLFKACLMLRRRLEKNETTDVAAEIIGRHLWFDLADDDVRKRLERLATKGETDVRKAAVELLASLSDQASEELSSAIAALKRYARKEARAMLGGMSSADFDAGIRSGRIRLTGDGPWTAIELDICRAQMLEATKAQANRSTPKSPREGLSGPR